MQAKVLFAMPNTPRILQGPHAARTMPSEVVVGASKASLLSTMAPVQRRQRRRDEVRRYEAKRPAMETEMTPLKASMEPMLMRPSRQARTQVTATA